MSEASHHLAQVNIARMRAPIDDPIMADFVAQLESVNAMADASPGFVWRLADDSGVGATAIQAFEDPLILINMSVWETVAALEAFTYRSRHSGLLKDRKKWFEPLDRPHLALWWIPRGQIPSAGDARERLDLLKERGPSPEAFTFREPFPAPLVRR